MEWGGGGGEVWGAAHGGQMSTTDHNKRLLRAAIKGGQVRRESGSLRRAARGDLSHKTDPEEAAFCPGPHYAALSPSRRAAARPPAQQAHVISRLLVQTHLLGGGVKP